MAGRVLQVQNRSIALNVFLLLMSDTNLAPHKTRTTHSRTISKPVSHIDKSTENARNMFVYVFLLLHHPLTSI